MVILLLRLVQKKSVCLLMFYLLQQKFKKKSVLKLFISVVWAFCKTLKCFQIVVHESISYDLLYIICFPYSKKLNKIYLVQFSYIKKKKTVVARKGVYRSSLYFALDFAVNLKLCVHIHVCVYMYTQNKPIPSTMI